MDADQEALRDRSENIGLLGKLCFDHFATGESHTFQSLQVTPVQRPFFRHFLTFWHAAGAFMPAAPPNFDRHPKIGQRKQCTQLRSVLRQAALAHFGVPELPFARVHGNAPAYSTLCITPLGSLL